MHRVLLGEVIQYCDRALRTGEFKDWDGAFNGLQAANSGHVSRIAAAVDGTLATARLAVAAGADLLLVHHGLFWELQHPWTGRRYELIRLLTENNLAVYSSHLPLDAHPRLGNNVGLCRALGFRRWRPFFEAKGHLIGRRTTSRIRREQLAARLARATGAPPRLLPGGPAICQEIGVVTGGAGGDLREAAAAGVDTFITGEGPNWTFGVAEELGLNVFYAGHYATETFGVKALAAELGRRFRLPWSFVDHPTGL